MKSQSQWTFQECVPVCSEESCCHCPGCELDNRNRWKKEKKACDRTDYRTQCRWLFRLRHFSAGFSCLFQWRKFFLSLFTLPQSHGQGEGGVSHSCAARCSLLWVLYLWEGRSAYSLNAAVCCVTKKSLNLMKNTFSKAVYFFCDLHIVFSVCVFV